MTFFLEQHGVRLSLIDERVPDKPAQPVDPPRVPARPTLSPLGFVVLDNGQRAMSVSSNADPTSAVFRERVFRSFSKVALLIEDTNALVTVAMRVTTDDALLITVPTINKFCSKMHVEDLSPTEQSGCNHYKSNCDNTHVGYNDLLISPEDYEPCLKKNASFQVQGNSLWFLRGESMIDLNMEIPLKDGYYTLVSENF